MALKKLQDTRFGIDASYWRLENITFSHTGKNINCNFVLLINSSATNGLDNKHFAFQVTSEDLNCDIRVLCYNKVKELSEFFLDAEDC